MEFANGMRTKQSFSSMLKDLCGKTSYSILILSSSSFLKEFHFSLRRGIDEYLFAVELLMLRIGRRICCNSLKELFSSISMPMTLYNSLRIRLISLM